MALQQTLVIHEALDSPHANGAVVSELFAPYAEAGVSVQVITVNNAPPENTSHTTDFITIVIPGSAGKRGGGKAPTLGVIGRNGAIGARPELVGLVSDADGPIGCLAVALKLAQMKARGDHVAGDVIVTTHLSTNVSMVPHDPVPFMGMPVSSDTMNDYQVLPEMDAILSIDASKGNSIVKHRGFAISPTALQGYILRVAPDLVATMESTTGCPAVTFPISLQDITPYHNGLYHFNSIMQPHVATQAPVVGVAVTAQSVVSGSATSANHEIDIAEAVRFCVEVSKRFGAGKCQFFNAAEWEKIRAVYPDLSVFQTAGKR
ncbi:DUF1177 domain-containing protein [Cupriavidus necator]|uniref:DUF1177 domain-containing protein n=1 Tax=Cupriavidus necator TaxID=106590 RepID=UPI00148FA3F5|nr:DUF1177 domain-containing protein [Cupriavidus necator]NOV27025.1 DUF1177 domain-containing protein [Cupriavidus necator]